MKGTAQVFCGYDEADPTAIVVAVFVEDAVEDARFIVKPVSNAESASAFPPSERKPPVNIPKKKATCIRVPLPPVPSDVRKFNVSVSGFSGKELITGGQIECEPRPVLNWDCKIQ
jgi:hypothetical protein